MSAWIVSKGHIDCLVQTCVVEKLVPLDQATETGRMLWRECLASVAARYPNDGDGDRPGPIDFHDSDVDTYVFTGIEAPLDPYIVFYQAGCYDYQSCEHPEWEASEAKALNDKLRGVLATKLGCASIEAVYKLPRRADAPWGINNIAQAVLVTV